MDTIYRWSRKSDFNEIKNLLIMCFGDRVDTNAYENIVGRYLLCIIENKIMAMSGLCFKSDVSENVIEISWTCTHPDYRNRGLIIEIFRRLINTTDEDIYCYCWRIGDNEKVNLQSLLDLYNFKKIQANLNKKTWKECQNYSIKRCSYYNEQCSCCQDLFFRKGLYEYEE